MIVPGPATAWVGLAPLQAGDVLVAVAGVDLARVIGMALLGLLAGTLVAGLYRGSTGDRAPVVYPLVVGLGAVGVWLNTASVLVAVLGDGTVFARAATNVVALGAGGAGALAGARGGDRLAPDVLALSGRRDLDREVSRVVQTVGRFTTVRLPKRIDDIDGYEPVREETKAELAGRELVFPRGLTVDQLRERLVDRLKADYGVGHVDAEVTETGELTHFAVGRRTAGVGATLPPRTAALAVTADPAFDASPDDRVQVWERAAAGDGDGVAPPAERVVTANVRAVDGDAVTLTLPTRQARRVDPSAEHRLVTLPAGARPEREFAALLRASDHTMDAVRVVEGSALDGLPVGALRVAVVAVRAAGPVATLPPPERVLRAGDTAYVVGREDQLRRVRAAAGG